MKRDAAGLASLSGHNSRNCRSRSDSVKNWRSRANRLTAVIAAFVGMLAQARQARGQACCAGAAAVTPARLAVHEDALVGAQVRAANLFGSFSPRGSYVAASATEWDIEQDLFGALRFAPRAQAALLVPAVETYRRAKGPAGTLSDFGGGIGDVNLSARYDFTLAGESKIVPGIAALAGLTFPTGRPPDSSDGVAHPLAADATGIGAWQLNLGITFEQTTGPWLFGVTGLYAKRTTRTVGTASVSLGAQWSAMAAAAYTFSNDAALAIVAAYSFEGNTEADGVESPESSRRIPQLTIAGLYPWSDHWRLQGAVFAAPPVSQLGKNTPASLGMLLGVVRSWS
jgi:hypothetical protein